MYTCFTGQLEPQAFFGEYNISSLPCVVKMICAGIEEDLGPLRKDEQAQMCTKCMCVCALHTWLHELFEHVCSEIGKVNLWRLCKLITLSLSCWCLVGASACHDQHKAAMISLAFPFSQTLHIDWNTNCGAGKQMSRLHRRVNQFRTTASGP